jgi:toxin ParE1/3/4
MKPSELKKGARQDLREAAAWYRRKERGLARRFLAEFSRTIDRIEQDPAIGLPLVRGTRSVKVKRFPYRVVFREEAAVIVVFAVAHGSRRTNYWLRRVPKQEQ